MSALPNIRISNNKWLNVYENLDGVNYGQKISIENIGSHDIYITESDIEPSLENISYSALKPRVDFYLSEGSNVIWVYSETVDGIINVTLPGDTVDNVIGSIDSKIQEFVNQSLCDSKEIILELRLLNARFEEMANTKINENDIGKR